MASPSLWFSKYTSIANINRILENEYYYFIRQFVSLFLRLFSSIVNSAIPQIPVKRCFLQGSESGCCLQLLLAGQVSGCCFHGRGAVVAYRAGEQLLLARK